MVCMTGPERVYWVSPLPKVGVYVGQRVGNSGTQKVGIRVMGKCLPAWFRLARGGGLAQARLELQVNPQDVLLNPGVAGFE